MTTPRLLSNRYELGDTLGYGGMSEVHRGRDVRLGREVAIKVLRADLARDPQFQERFRREAQNAAALNHPAIVAVYDTGETRTTYGPLPYIVMEYVDGRTLRDIVKSEGPLPGQRAMEIMADVCAALDFSHRHGIVHRDVKPANVMITRNGAVKVMDFGIARAVADGQAAVTQTAAVIGTAQYLSPEQARGEAVDARSDVYASGCVLFELLTGEPPFTGDSPVAVAYQHVREDPKPPSALNGRVSPALDAVVLKAMAKGPSNRYQSAAEMRTDLVRVLSGQRPLAPMVMTEDDRTSVMANRQPDPRAGRHRPAAVTPSDYDTRDPYEDEEDERKRRRRKAWTVALITVLAMALIGVIAWLATLVFGRTETPNDQVTMPNVIGQTQAEANRVLREQGFVDVTTALKACQANPDGSPGSCGPDSIGKVLTTDPGANSSVKKSDKITLTVGAPPEKVSVPDVKGKTLDEATKALADAGLTVAANPAPVETDDQTLVGKVADQNPPAGQSVQAGSPVTLSIGKGPDTVTVPDLTRQKFDTAKANLEGLGFQVQREDVSSNEPEGTVVDQSPKSGKVRPGTKITLKVSKGDQQKIRLPDLIGMRLDEAQGVLHARGWTGQLNAVNDPTNDPREFDRITEQELPPGTEINQNDTVNVRVGQRQGG
jgi:beta-lactam-binding protein with PASTA domain/tRNA A-37 threonylcarbamoyl transferase component Bud32